MSGSAVEVVAKFIQGYGAIMENEPFARHIIISQMCVQLLKHRPA